MNANAGKFKCKANVDLAEMDGEWVLFNAETCQVTKLNELGGLIWTSLMKQEDVSRIVDRIREEYDIDRETAEQDCLRFIQQLKDIGLVEMGPSGA